MARFFVPWGGRNVSPNLKFPYKRRIREAFLLELNPYFIAVAEKPSSAAILNPATTGVNY
ncbi:MAG: hypothetical protein WA634_06280 [Silvibacterium sp.]